MGPARFLVGRSRTVVSWVQRWAVCGVAGWAYESCCDGAVRVASNWNAWSGTWPSSHSVGESPFQFLGTVTPSSSATIHTVRICGKVFAKSFGSGMVWHLLYGSIWSLFGGTPSMPSTLRIGDLGLLAAQLNQSFRSNSVVLLRDGGSRKMDATTLALLYKLKGSLKVFTVQYQTLPWSSKGCLSPLWTDRGRLLDESAGRERRRCLYTRPGPPSMLLDISWGIKRILERSSLFSRIVWQLLFLLTRVVHRVLGSDGSFSRRLLCVWDQGLCSAADGCPVSGTLLTGQAGEVLPH